MAPTHSVNLKRWVPASLPMRGVDFFHPNPFLSLDSKSKPALNCWCIQLQLLLLWYIFLIIAKHWHMSSVVWWCHMITSMTWWPRAISHHNGHCLWEWFILNSWNASIWWSCKQGGTLWWAKVLFDTWGFESWWKDFLKILSQNWWAGCHVSCSRLYQRMSTNTTSS